MPFSCMIIELSHAVRTLFVGVFFFVNFFLFHASHFIIITSLIGSTNSSSELERLLLPFRHFSNLSLDRCIFFLTVVFLWLLFLRFLIFSFHIDLILIHNSSLFHIKLLSFLYEYLFTDFNMLFICFLIKFS